MLGEFEYSIYFKIVVTVDFSLVTFDHSSY
jgi:hypothetical protein